MSAMFRTTGSLFRRKLMSRSFALLLVSGSLGACSDEERTVITGPEFSVSIPQMPANEYDRWAVVFNDSVSDVPAAVASIANEHSARVKYVWQHALKGFAGNFPEAAKAAILRNPRVAYIVENKPLQINTPQYSAPVALDRIDQRQTQLDGVYNYFFNGSGVNVYVVDSGIRTTHTQFGSRASSAYSFNGNYADNCGHGTAMASLIAGSDYGVAKNANVIAVKVQDGTGLDPATCNQGDANDFVSGLDWIRGHASAPGIVSMSIDVDGGYGPVDDAARNLVNAGFDLIAGAGNNPNSPACSNSPGRVGSVATVGATNDDGSFWSGNSAGACVKILAPGGYTTAANSTGDALTLYMTSGGTSAATAYVAGVAALILQQHPSMNPSAIAMYTSTSGVITNVPSGTGNKFLYSLHTYIDTNLFPPEILTSAGNYTWEAKGLGGVGSYSYTWAYSDDNVNWTTDGTGAVYTRYIPEGSGDYPFWVRVSMTSGTETFSTTKHHSVCTIGLGACSFQ